LQAVPQRQAAANLSRTLHRLRSSSHKTSKVLRTAFMELRKWATTGNFIPVPLGQIDGEFQSRENGAYMPASPG
jgi:hypothetical protein